MLLPESAARGGRGLREVHPAPALVVGILSDLHLGAAGEGRWHNRLLYDDAEEAARAAIALFNHAQPDMVVALGDLTNHSTESQLRLVQAIFSDLTMPWYVLPGNHDWAALSSGLMQTVFGAHLPTGYHPRNGIGCLFLSRELRPSPDLSTCEADLTALEQTIAAIQADRPRTILVFSHYPLVSEEEYARQRGGLYAGHLANGMALINRLAQRTANKVVVCCGHLHWQHISEGPNWIQCTTGALVEYPMECRLITVRRAGLHIETLVSASPELATRSLDAASWVRGEERDRSLQTHLAKG